MRADRKIVLVTGAGAGIGAALCRELLRRDCTVYAGVRNMSRAEKDFSDLADVQNFHILDLDVNDTTATASAVKRIESESGRLDVLVNNAGYGLYGVFEELADEAFRAQMETNFFAALRLMRLVLPGMRDRRTGLIMNVTSILGRVVLPTGSAYSASKFALEAASEVVRYEVAPFGVKVCAVEPGSIRTNFKSNMALAEDITANDSPYAFLNEQVMGEKQRESLLITSAASCARRMANIIEKRNPAQRYTIGIDAKLASFARWLLPTAWLDLAVRFYLTRAERGYKKS